MLTFILAVDLEQIQIQSYHKLVLRILISLFFLFGHAQLASQKLKNSKLLNRYTSVYCLVFTIVYPHEIRSNCVFLRRNCEWSNTRKTELYVHLKNIKIIKYKLFRLFTGFSLLQFYNLFHSNYMIKLVLTKMLVYIKVNA